HGRRPSEGAGRGRRTRPRASPARDRYLDRRALPGGGPVGWGRGAARGGGVVGGCVVAVFGYPTAREDHAARALWAGFEVLRRVPVPVRLGVDTGEVIAPAGEAGSLSGLGGAA